MIKHIIFDLDGVLVDAIELHYNAFKEAVYVVTGKTIDWEYHQNSLNGLPTKAKLEILGYRGKQVEKICELKQHITINEFNKLSKDTGLIEILDKLKSQYILSCASNSVRYTLETALYKLGILDFFSSYLSNNDVSKPKPSPEIYYKCMMINKLWVPQTMIIEDSPVGQEAILQSGCKGLIVKNRQDLTYNKIIERIHA